MNPLHFRSSWLTSLPDIVLVKIIGYIELHDLLLSVNRTCKKLHLFIRDTSYLWEDFVFEDSITLKKEDLKTVLCHSSAFKRLILSPFDVQCQSYEIDLLFSTHLKSKKLYWLSLTDVPISTLCFSLNTPNIEILNLSGCINLNDDDFHVLKNLVKLEQLYVSFTSIYQNTVCEIVRGKQLSVLDVCGVELSIETCNLVLRSCHSSLLFFHLSVDQSVSEQQFNRAIRDKFIDVNIKIYKQ